MNLGIGLGLPSTKLYIRPFIIEVDTSITGVSNNDQFQFTGAEGDYDVVAKQGRTIMDTFNDLSNEETITFSNPGVYYLEIIPKRINGFNRINFSDGGDKLKLTDIKQWGTTVWSSFEGAFRGCNNFKGSFTDSPNLTNVNSFRFMFREATLFNQPINNWDTSNVTNMERMFGDVTSFNQPLDSWDVSNVTIMRNMFLNTTLFNQPLNNWDVSSVDDMPAIFQGTSSFNQPLNNWDVSQVTSMENMFRDAESFNHPLNNWDVSSVTSMENMFRDAESFNQPLNNWDVSSVTNMFGMFHDSSSFNQPLDNWDTSNVTDMRSVFRSMSFNQDISNWDTSKVTSMQAMFYNNGVFNYPIDSWDTSKVEDMGYVFNGATSFDSDLSGWDVSNVTDMTLVFSGSDLSAENLTLIYENWSLLTLQQDVPFGASGIQYFSSGQAGRNTMVNTYNWTITDGGLLETPFIIEIDSTESGVSNSDQFQFTGAEGDYDVVAKQNDIVVANFNDLSNQETITLPSSGVYVLEVKSKEVNGFNRIAFDNGGDKDKIIDIKQWGDVVWSSFEESFIGCSNLLATATDAPDLSNVTNMGYMFLNASSANPDTSNWDVSNVTSMNRMFFGATSANPDTSNWDVGSVTNMRSMFKNAFSANPDVSNWDVSNVTSMNRMFFGATSANPNTLNWDVSSVTIMDRMLENSNLSEENLTAIYENWSQLNLQQNVTFSAGTIKYNSSGQAGRDILVNTYNWIIEDGG